MSLRNKSKADFQLSFFGAIRNDWNHVAKLLASIDSVFWYASKEVVLVDDYSNSEQTALAHSLLEQHKSLSVIFNKTHQGIVPCLNLGIAKISGKLALPVAADTYFVGPFLPLSLLYAFAWHNVDFFFAKTLHLEQDTMRKTGITGWAVKKGIQCRIGVIDNFISGKSRPSGSAVAFRTEILKKYRYDATLGPLSDFYLNNLMVLTHKAFYCGKVISRTLERRSSYSNSFDQTQSLALVEKAVMKFESDGVMMTDAQKDQYLAFERSRWVA